MLHTGILYKHIHKIHHKYSAPFGLAAEYAHPAEVMILGAGTIAGPLLYCYFTRDFHILTMYIWILLRLFQAIDAHSGYGTFLPPIFLVSISKKFVRFSLVPPTHPSILVRR
jgi:methylsterol monooxygenase